MRKVLLGILLAGMLSLPVSALELTAPQVPGAGQAYMPEQTDAFGAGLLELLQNVVRRIRPELDAAVQSCSGIVFAAMLFSLLPLLSERIKPTAALAGTVTIGAMLLRPMGTMIGYASDTVLEICNYGKLICPVLTAALAAQGGITASGALYTGTTIFITILSMLASRWFVPMIYLYLVFSVGHSALGAEIMKKIGDAIKNILNWLVKTLLVVFTSYMSITGVVSGTTDAAALKATKVTISSVVPVVGGILSDASESVLVSMGILKNAAGVYGILAVLAVAAGPFLSVGVQYLLLKLSAAICGLFGNKGISGMVGDFSTAMGLLLAMVASGCLMVLISTVCYLKGLG